MASIDERICKLNERLESARDKYLDNQIDSDEYHNMKQSIDRQKVAYQRDMADLKVMDANFLDYMNFTLQLIEKIDLFYKMSSVEVKRKILVSIFPEKLTFSNEKYRTTKTNEVFSAITMADNGFGGKENGREGILANSSNWAPPPGLEPGTL